MEAGQYAAAIKQLLEESPISTPSVIVDVHDLVAVGEYDPAFHVMCSWIYEDDLPISAEFHRRLVHLSAELGSRDLVAAMSELVSE